MSEEFKKIILISDYGSLNLTKKVYSYLKNMNLHGGLKEFNPDDMYLNQFNNGEIEVKFNINIRDRDVFILKSPYTIQRRWDKKIDPGLGSNVNQSYMEMFIINDALRRSSARTITNIMSFMPYQRSDKKDQPRVPITASLMAHLTEESGANRIINFNPHAEQIQGYYKIPFDALYSDIVFAEYIENNFKDLENWIIFGPDAGSDKRTKILAKWLGLPAGIGSKDRPKPGEVSNIMIPQGIDIKGKKAILLDDMADTLGSAIRCSENLYEAGITKVVGCFSHPILTGDAKERALQSGLEIITTDTIPILDIDKYPNITILSLAEIISEAIKCICTGDSISEHLFSYLKYKKWKQEQNIIL